jgi:thymidylate synthase (FAD)
MTACDNKLTDLLHGYKRKAQHWAPFAHPHVQIRVRMPLFLARQFVKHQIGGTWSEESRRYISDEPGVWFPAEWHTRPEDIKQGSGGLVRDQQACTAHALHATTTSLRNYAYLLEDGVAPEEARTVLPLNMMTTVVWTGSLLFWSRVCNLRVDSHAQLAAQELGKLIADIVGPLYPESWKALTC